MQMQVKMQKKAEITYLEAKKKTKKKHTHTKKVPPNISEFRSRRRNTIVGFNAIVQHEK